MSYTQSIGGTETSSVTLPQYSNGCTSPSGEEEETEVASEASTASEDQETVPSPITSEEEVCDSLPVSRKKSRNGYEDSFDFKIELRSMKSQIRQLQKELAFERENVLAFRKKLTQTHKERLEHTTRFNEEAAKLKCENAYLLAQLEKQGEFTERMEFEVTKVKKQMKQEKHSAEDKETHDEKIIHELEERQKESTAKLVKLEEELSASKRIAAAELHELKQTIDNRDKIISQTCQEQQILHSEKLKLQEFIKQQENAIKQQQEKALIMDAEVSNAREHLQVTARELEKTKDVEERQAKELDELRTRCSGLTDAIEAERAAHLESKFNGEIVQLKIKDLENSVDEQKISNHELQGTLEKLTSQLRDMEQAYADERKEHRCTQEKLEKCDKEFTLSQRQLQTELSDKRSLVSNLKRQLDTHQINVDELKVELGKAKKRQLYLEETYGGSMRELELLLVNFDLSGNANSDKVEEGKSIAPATVVETLRHTLSIYKKRLETSTEEVNQLKVSMETLSKETRSYKDMLWEKEKALGDAQQTLSRMNKELEKMKTSSSDLEARLATMKVDMQSVKHEGECTRSRYEAIQNEMTNLKMRHLQETEERMRFMHGLYQRLMVGSEVKVQRSPSDKPGKYALENFTWSDLSAMVLEQTVSLLSESTNIKDKLQRTDDLILKKDSYLEELRRDHEQQLSNMVTTIENNNRDWQNEKRKLEEHYSDLLAENQSKQQSHEKKADEAWEKVRNTNDVVHQLEAECTDMRGKVSILQKHNSSLLCALALMFGAYFPLLSRSKQLARQRSILEDQFIRYEKFKTQTCVLLQLLTSEGPTSGEPGRSSCKRLLKFRRAVLAVMAANRFRKCTRGQQVVFTFNDYDSSQSVVGLGSLRKARSPRGSPVVVESRDEVINESDIIDWLSNKELIPAVMSCTDDVTDALKRLSKREGSIRPGFLVSAARTSFKKLVEHMEALYPSCMDDVKRSPQKERLGILKLLNRGLFETMSQSCLESKMAVLPTQQVFTSLQEKVLEFINKMHSSEMERKSMKKKIAGLMLTTNELKGFEDSTRALEVQVHALKNQVQKMVPAEKFEGVVGELNMTLCREKQAQDLLNEQSSQLRELNRRLNEESTEKFHKEQTLQQVAQKVKESHADLTGKEELIQQLSKHVSQLENERKDLHDNIFDAEQALRTAAHDRDSLSNYIRTLQSTFDKCRGDVVTTDVSKILLSKDLFPSGKAGPDLLACQSMVNSFVDVLRSIHNHIAGLTDEISSHKTHIARLKEELAAACRRQMGLAINDQMGVAADYDKLESTRLHSSMETSTPRFDRTINRTGGAEYGLRNETENSDGNARPTGRSSRSQSTRYSSRHTPASQDHNAVLGNGFRTPTVTSRSRYSTETKSTKR